MPQRRITIFPSTYSPVVFTSAVAAFGGSSAFAWMSQMLQTKWFPEVSDEFVIIDRNWTWVIIAVILAIFHMFVLGPGVEF